MRDFRLGPGAEVIPQLPVAHPDLMYPHQNPERLPGGVIGNTTAPQQLGRLLLGNVISRLAHAQPSLESLYALAGRLTYRALNGEVGIELQNKEYFGNAIRALGYLAPSSVSVEPGGASLDTLEAVEVLQSDSDQRFCKPLNGWQGRGIFVAGSPEEALNFVARSREPYLVQSFEEPQQDWRYILHRDVNQLRGGEPSAWRIAYGKVRPHVVGDGQRTIRQLVDSHPDMPNHAMRKYRNTHQDSSRVVPEAGEDVSLVESGNISQGAYARMPNPTEEQNLDIFMTRFLATLEAHIGGVLGTACFDIGVKDASVLNGEYNEETLRRNVVFYELQVPFGMNGYLNLLPETRNLWGATLPSIVKRRFHNSMLASGRILQTLSTRF